jgi:surfactin synthase thioesterase subunit
MTTEQAQTVTPRWLTPTQPAPHARIRLFLLPHAGSGAVAYKSWHRLLPEEISAQAVTLPGRQGRRAEPLPVDWHTVVDDLYTALRDELDDRPYALFGHCIGAQLAYRLTVRLEAEGDPRPSLVGISGWAPVGFFRAPNGSEEVSISEAAPWIKNLGALPEDVWSDPDMLDLVLPPVMADFRVSAQYEDDGSVIDAPLVSYSGRSDPLLVEPDAMASWTGRSRNHLGHNTYAGGHFYVTEHATAVVSDFSRRLIRIVNTQPAKDPQ